MTKIEEKPRKELAAIREELTSLRTEMRQAVGDVSRDLSFLTLRFDTFKSNLNGLENHVRGLETAVRDGFTKLTELLNEAIKKS